MNANSLGGKMKLRNNLPSNIELQLNLKELSLIISALETAENILRDGDHPDTDLVYRMCDHLSLFVKVQHITLPEPSRVEPDEQFDPLKFVVANMEFLSEFEVEVLIDRMVQQRQKLNETRARMLREHNEPA
jgi:hypothetical protein